MSAGRGRAPARRRGGAHRAEHPLEPGAAGPEPRHPVGAEGHGLLGPGQPGRRVADEDRDLADPPPPLGVAGDVDRRVQRGGDLGVDREPRQPGQRGQRLEPGRDVGGGVGVDGAAAALVTGVHRGQQVGDLGAAHLADHEPVRPHPQRLPDEVGQRDGAGELGVGRAALHPDHVRVRGRELAGVLDDDDPLVRRDQREQGREQRRLAAAGAAADQEGEPGSTIRAEQLGRRPGSASPTPRSRRARTSGSAGTRRLMQVPGVGDRAQHRVDPAAVGEPGVDERHGVVQAPTDRRRQALGQPTHLGLRGEPHRGALQPAPAVDEDLVRRR